MDWVLTNAQYELSICDCPVIVYNNKDNSKKKHTAKEMDDLMSKWEERKRIREERGEKVGLSAFLDGSWQNKGLKN